MPGCLGCEEARPPIRVLWTSLHSRAWLPSFCDSIRISLDLTMAIVVDFFNNVCFLSLIFIGICLVCNKYVGFQQKKIKTLFCPTAVPLWIAYFFLLKELDLSAFSFLVLLL